MITRGQMSLEPLKGRLWRLLNTMEYRWDGITFVIPPNFIFDGASIPRFARILIPKNGVKLYAACFHDYLYRFKPISRKQADVAFLRVLLEKGEPKWSSYSMYFVLRVLGWTGWHLSKSG